MTPHTPVQPKDLSTCCSAPVKASIADEGTGCYLCTACGKPCDIQAKLGKSFFDYSDKEKKRILTEASIEGSKMQRELVESVKSKEKKILVLTPERYKDKAFRKHCESMGAIVVENKPSPPQEAEWEVVFDKEFGSNLWKEVTFEIKAPLRSWVTCNEDVKSFIRSTLQEQKEKVVEEIRKQVSLFIKDQLEHEVSPKHILENIPSLIEHIGDNL
jgi:hypothetical protein